MTAADAIALTIVGIPQPKGSKTAFVRGGKAVLVEGASPQARGNFASWREAVERECRDYIKKHRMAALAEPVSISARFRFPMLASDKYRTAHCTKPDIDKLERALYDALVSGGLLVDDCWIWSTMVSKRHCIGDEPPGATVVVTPQGNMEAALRTHRKRKAAEQRRKVPSLRR